MNAPVLVIGAGTAGIAAAIFLRQSGLEVVLTDRVTKPDVAMPVIGESLSPDAQPLLQELGIWDDFNKATHLKCYSNVSYWYSTTARHHDFLQHPVGHGWHLDRALFDQQLLQRCLDLGTDYRPETSISQWQYEQGAWDIQLEDQYGLSNLKASFVIDATGRNSWWARQQGIDRLYEAEQLALVAFLQIAPDFEDSRTLVETTDQGWWYTAAIPGNRMATAFFFDPNRLDYKQLANEASWYQLLSGAAQTQKRVTEASGSFMYMPKLVAAHSSILERLQGPGWLAIGDAAFTYDPIAAHGITMAMTSARDGVRAITATIKGDEEAPERYEALLWAAFQRYAQDRQQFTQA